jgi:hypothetical protein
MAGGDGAVAAVSANAKSPAPDDESQGGTKGL